MSIYAIRTAGVLPLALSSHWQYNSRKLQRLGLKLPSNLIISIKSCNQSKWSRRASNVKNFTTENLSQEQNSFGRLLKPLVFTVTVSGASFAGAAIWQYENVRHQASLTKRLFGGIKAPKYGQFRQHLNSWWNNLSPGDKAFAPICGINVLVYLAWLVPAWQPIMIQYFTAGLVANAQCWPMLFSVFSHYSLLHLAANMFVLRSFSDKIVSGLGKEQFAGLYLSAGVISSFTSLVYKTIIKSPATSLGASGAVMCMLAYVCTKYPHSQLAVIFLPQFPFESEKGLKALICFDTLGCILRWKFFDHAAHLGGSLFGIAWYHWGDKFIWKKREPLVSAWHELRGPV